METITRRNFLGAATGAATLGLAGASGIIPIVRAEAKEASAKADAKGMTGAQVPEAPEMPTDTTLAYPGDASTALLPDGRLDPVRLATTDLTNEQIDAMLAAETPVAEDYTTASGKVVPAVYVAMRNRLNRIGVGFGSQVVDPDTAFEILQTIEPDEQEAQAYLEIPLYGWFSAADFAATSGRPLEECADYCEGMADKSLIIATTRAGVRYFATMAPLWGVWEMNMDKFTKDWCSTFNQALGADFAMGAVNSVRPVCAIVPCSEDVVEGEMAPYTNWKDTVNNAERFALSPCQCRLERDLLGTAVCTPEQHPRKTCISVGEAAEYFIDRGIGEEITKQEAFDEIQSHVDKGMVVEQLWSKKSEVICGCHGDCCKLLSTYVALNGEGNMMQNISAYNLVLDKDKCIKCGACVDRCTMFAVTMGDDGYPQMDKKCIRCGQCALVCPAGARKLVAKPTEELLELPDDMIDDYQQLGRIRMATGYVHDFDGTSAK
ncbi:4Fe-4S binding protein [bacterium]|nr:4Fe-4S binding protein [bacterium]